MKVNELNVRVRVRNTPINNKVMTQEQSNFINSALAQDKELLEKHSNGKERLLYVFNRLAVLEGIKHPKVINKGVVCDFTIRSNDVKFLAKLSGLFNLAELDKKSNLEYISSNLKKRDYINVKNLKTVTPLQLKDKTNEKHNLLPSQFNLVKKALNESLVIKFNNNNDLGIKLPLDYELFTTIVLDTNPYLLQMDKFAKKGIMTQLCINSELEYSEELLQFAMNTGVGFRNSYMGSGYLIPINEIRL